MIHWSLLLVGFVVGFVMGLTSVGGAALMTPFLILGLDVSPFLAVGTDLVYGTITRVAGAWMHWRQGTADIRMARRMSCGSVPGCLAGVLLVNLLHGHWGDADIWLRRAIGGVLVLVALLLAARTLRLKVILWRPVRPDGRGLVPTAAVAGFLVGFTSIGAGSLLAPILITLFPKQTARAVGTDIVHAALLAGIAGLAHAASRNVAWAVIPALLAGSLPGVLLGSYLAPRTPSRWLRIGLAVVLLASGIKLF